MKRLALIAVSVLLALALRAAADEPTPLRWERLAPMPVGVFDAAISRSGDAAVVSGGIDQIGQALGWAQVFDLRANAWKQPIRLVTPRCLHAQATLPDGRVLVAGGKVGSVPGNLRSLRSAELIDLKAGRSTALPDLPQALAEPTAHTLPDGRAIVIGGTTASVFDPGSGQWSRHIGLRDKRTGHASVMLDDGRVVAIGGVGRTSIELIDPARGLSTMLAARLPQPTDDLAAVALDANRVWICGGQDPRRGDTIDETWVLDLSNADRATLTEGPRLGVDGGVSDHCAVRVGRWVFVAGGETQRDNRDAELSAARILGIETMRIWSLPAMSVAHDDAVALPAERGVIVFGGYRLVRGPIEGVRVPVAVTVVEKLELPAERF